MSCKIRGALLMASLALMLPMASLAQISFIPGPPRQVPNGPSFVTAADFNGDGIGDAVVASTVRDRVTVLFGSPNGDFESVVEIPVGALLRGITTGDFNGDRINDIAVTDTYSSRLFIVSGNGTNGKNNGSFSSPQSYQTARRGPVWVATGNFDGKTGLDAATANGQADSFSILANEGGNKGLKLTGSFPTGLNPRVLIAYDLNGDRVDDVLTLDTGTRGTDEVSLYLNSGTGTFQGTVPQRFVVGVGAVSMDSGDFNNDGKTDIVVLNGRGAVPNAFTISVLLGQSDPTFRVLAPIEYTCPSRLNGIPIVCTPQSITVADFDLDTFDDIAISFSTRATDTQQVTAGFVNAYAGNGAGSFEFATQIIVGLGPRNILAHDVTGDAVPDVIVTEFGQNTVQVLKTKPVPPRSPGQPCNVGRQCESGACVDGVCCASAACPPGQRCDVYPPNSSQPDGTCKDPAPNGTQCSIGAQCDSGRCVDGFCCASAACPQGQFCNTGSCMPPSSNGTPCTAGEQCSSGNCVDGVCCTDEQCAINAACNIPGSEGQCTTRLPVGSPCTDAAQCCTSTDPTMCDPSYCVDGFCCEEQCDANQTCGAPGREGQCVARPTRTATPVATPTPQPNGAPCNSPSQCSSGFCTNGVCCNVAQCPAGQSCSIPADGKNGSCSTTGGPGSPCNGPEDCTTNICIGNVCAVPSPTPTPQPGGKGDPCSNTSQCAAPLVCNTEEGGICCNLAQCPEGQSCRLDNKAGSCSVIPTPLPGPGTPCTTGTQCDSGNCVNNVCCEIPACDPGTRCDITGFAGSCVEPLPFGEPCTKNSDCQTGLTCYGAPPSCQPPPSPTATIIVLPPDTPTAVVVTSTNRSGGCAIDTQNGAGGALLLLALPFVLWVRRRGTVALAHSRNQ